MILKQIKVTRNDIVDSTRGGQKRLIVGETVSGDEIQIWRPIEDESKIAAEIVVGERILVAIDSKNKGHLIDNSKSADLEPAPPGSVREKILDYMERMSRLYAHAYGAVECQMETRLDTPEIKDVATTIFIAATRHFNL